MLIYSAGIGHTGLTGMSLLLLKRNIVAKSVERLSICTSAEKRPAIGQRQWESIKRYEAQA